MNILSTSVAYWESWRVFLCFLPLLTTISWASYIIKKYEGPKGQRSTREQGEDVVDDVGVVFEHELWKPCWRETHPAWLLGYRVLSFFTLSFTLIMDVIFFGWQVFYYYTEWLYVFLILFFWIGSLLSAYGCYRGGGGNRSDELGQTRPYQVVGIWGYIFQIIYQILAGAVVLANCEYWFLNAPYVVKNSNTIAHVVSVIMHLISFPVFFGDVVLNSLRFPLFRIAYFGIWTCIFVFSHWLLHFFIPTWWPSLFLNVSQPLAPLWYLLMILFHVPSYGVFFFLIKAKHFLLRDQ